MSLEIEKESVRSSNEKNSSNCSEVDVGLIVSLMLVACSQKGLTHQPILLMGENSTTESASSELYGSGDTLIVGLDDTFPPMGFRDDSGALVGFDIDLANEIGKRLGYTMDFQSIDWS